MCPTLKFKTMESKKRKRVAAPVEGALGSLTSDEVMYGEFEFCPLKTFPTTFSLSEHVPLEMKLTGYITDNDQEHSLQITANECGKPIPVRRCGMAIIHKPTWESTSKTECESGPKEKQIQIRYVRQACEKCMKTKIKVQALKSLDSRRMESLLFKQYSKQLQESKEHPLEINSSPQLSVRGSSLVSYKGVSLCETETHGEVQYLHFVNRKSSPMVCNWDHMYCINAECKSNRIAFRTFAWYFNGYDSHENIIPFLEEWQCLDCKMFILHGHVKKTTGSYTTEQRSRDLWSAPPSDEEIKHYDPTMEVCEECKKFLWEKKAKEQEVSGCVTGKATSMGQYWCEECACYFSIARHNE